MHTERFVALIAGTFICLPSVSTMIGCSERKLDSQICDVFQRAMSTAADERRMYRNAQKDAATVLSEVTTAELLIEIARLGPEIRLHTTSTDGLLENPRKDCVLFCAHALSAECVRRQELELMSKAIREIPLSEFEVSLIELAEMQWGSQLCGIDIMYKALIDPAVNELVAMQLGHMLSIVFDCDSDATSISQAYSTWDSKRGEMCIDPGYSDRLNDFGMGRSQEHPRGMFRACN